MIHAALLLDLALGALLKLKPLGKVVVPNETAETKSTRRLKPGEQVASYNGSADKPSVLRSTELLRSNHNECKAQRSEGETDCPGEAFGVSRLPDRMRMEHN